MEEFEEVTFRCDAFKRDTSVLSKSMIGIFIKLFAQRLFLIEAMNL